MVRRSLLVIATLTGLIAGLLSFAPQASAADGDNPMCPTTIGARLLGGTDIFANREDSTIRVEVGNLSNVGVTQLRMIRPSTTYEVTGGSSDVAFDAREPSYFTTSVDEPTSVTFTGLLPAGSRGRFKVVVDTLSAPADVLSKWTIEASTDMGRSFCQVGALDSKPWFLNGNVRVLEFGNPAQVTTPGADDGSATSGQAVDIRIPVINHATASHTVSEYWATGDTEGTLADEGSLVAPLSLAPGESGVINVRGFTFGEPVEYGRFRLFGGTADKTAQTGTNLWIDVEEAATFAPDNGNLLMKSFTCDKTVANGGAPLTCSVVVDKTAGTAAVLDESTTLVLDDGNGATYEAALASPVSFAQGSVSNVKLQFATATVPSEFVGGAYAPTVVLSGSDSNNAPVAGELVYTASIVVDAAPQMASATTAREGTQTVIRITMTEPVTGTKNQANWAVIDNFGVKHPVRLVSANVTGTVWSLYLSATPAFDPNSTATVTYTPGDLEDSAGSPLPESTVTASDGIA